MNDPANSLPQPVSFSQEAAQWAMELKDGLGQELDPEIVHAVAGLYRMGVITTQSCAGHRDRAMVCPWIDIHLNRPGSPWIYPWGGMAGTLRKIGDFRLSAGCF